MRPRVPRTACRAVGVTPLAHVRWFADESSLEVEGRAPPFRSCDRESLGRAVLPVPLFAKNSDTPRGAVGETRSVDPRDVLVELTLRGREIGCRITSA